MTAVLDHTPRRSDTALGADAASAVESARPNRATLRVRPAPRREPPFDDERPADQLRLIGGFAQTLPFEPWDGRLNHTRPWASARPTGRGELPEPGAWARRLLVALLEVQTGRRPLQQLSAQLSHAVQLGLANKLESGAWPSSVPTALRSIRAGEPADGVAEISAVIQVGSRYRAIAARLEGLDGRWRCVRLQIG